MNNEKKSGSLVCFKNCRKEWLLSGLLWVLFWTFFMFYHQLRGKPYSFFTASKCFGIAAIFLVGWSLALGPWVRLGKADQSVLRYRRPVGVLGVVSAVIHVVLSLTCLNDRFAMSYYLDHSIATVAGIVAFVVLLSNVAASSASVAERMGMSAWKTMQRLLYPAFALALMHFVLLDKIPNWIKWLKTFDPVWPPGTFPTFVFGCLVLMLWVVDRWRKKT